MDEGHLSFHLQSFLRDIFLTHKSHKSFAEDLSNDHTPNQILLEPVSKLFY